MNTLWDDIKNHLKEQRERMFGKPKSHILYLGLTDLSGIEVDYMGYERQVISLTRPFYNGRFLEVTNENEIIFPNVELPTWLLEIYIAGVFISNEKTDGVIVKRGPLSVRSHSLKSGSSVVIYPKSLGLQIT